MSHPRLQRLTRSSAARRFSATAIPLRVLLRATLLSERRTVLQHWLRQDSRLVPYRLAKSHHTILLRSHLGGLEIVDEVFRQRLYDPSSPARSAILASPSSPVILGLRANIGISCLRLLDLFPNSTLYAYEADSANANAPKACLMVNDLLDRSSVIEACVSNRVESVSFRGGLGSSSAIIREDCGQPGDTQVQTVDILPRIATADLVKMDIEGSEWSILTDSCFLSRRPRALTMEYHRYGCPTRGDDHMVPDPHPRKLAITLLRAAGVTVAPVVHNEWGHGVLWA